MSTAFSETDCQRAAANVPKFKVKHTLASHSQPIGALAVSPDHAYLLSSSDDSSVIVWDLADGRPIQVIKADIHGPIQSAVWVYTLHGACPGGLLFGCADGTVHYYKKDPAGSGFLFVSAETVSPPAPIEFLAFDMVHSYVGIASSGRCSLWRLGRKGLAQVHCTSANDAIISSIFFLDQGALLVVSFVESQEMVAYQTDSWEEAWRRTLRTRIGHAVASPNNTILVSNLVDGVDIYSIPPVRLLKTLIHGEQNFRLQLGTFSDGALTIVGSEKARPLVLDQEGNVRQALLHDSVVVPTVTSSQLGQERYIVTGAITSPFHIKVWYAKEADAPLINGNSLPSSGLTFSMLQLFTIAFLSILVQVLLSNISYLSEVVKMAQEMMRR